MHAAAIEAAAACMTATRLASHHLISGMLADDLRLKVLRCRLGQSRPTR